ncbi:hypothetical protein BDV06DRAFT_194330 [Aspergillus oleicola]
MNDLRTGPSSSTYLVVFHFLVCHLCAGNASVSRLPQSAVLPAPFNSHPSPSNLLVVISHLHSTFYNHHPTTQ